METKRVILARSVDFAVLQQMCYHGNRMSDFPKKSFFVEKKINFGSFCLNFTFSTIFLVNNGHRVIKVHVNKV